MHASHRTTSTIVGAVLALTATTLVACGHTVVAGGQGSLNGEPASASAAGPGATGTPGTSITTAPGTTPTSVKTTNGHSGGNGGTEPSASVSPSTQTGPPPVVNDYKILFFHPCFWALDSNDGGDLIVGAELAITYTGTTISTTVPFRMTDNVDSDSATNPAEPVGKPFNAGVGDPGAHTRYPGSIIKVTGTISPPGDTDPSNNSITLTIHVPSNGLPTSTTTIPISNCDVS
jgi:hypothetical protein